jgi:sterol desaturase/sphingolipid hydroxylase (fatty acid hydroxylase superfamily)
METYGKILLVAMPVFLIFVLFEKWYGRRKGFDTFRNMDMISSLSSGITNVTKDVLGLSLAIVSYSWFVEKMAIVHVSNTPLTYLIAFVALDFSGYWIHRIAHEYNFFWNNHLIHHSSEEFNLACALRQSISVFFRIFTFFLIPAALLGVPAQVIAITAPLHLFAQFWYHTRHIGKMGFLEKIIVTPSHHRVHHAINTEYMDRNYGQIFIFWDKWFGTYQEEIKDVPPVYGITRPARTWNPIKINFQHFFSLMQDAWRTKNWKDKFRIWLMPTGWRPDDMTQRFPIFKIEDPQQYAKYDTPASNMLKIWSWIQITVTLLFISYLFARIAEINATNSYNIYLYGSWIFLMVYAYTDLMDRNPSAMYAEWIKNVYGVWLLYYTDGWFGLESKIPGATLLLITYFLIASVMVSYLTFKHKGEDAKAVSNIKLTL